MYLQLQMFIILEKHAKKKNFFSLVVADFWTKLNMFSVNKTNEHYLIYVFQISRIMHEDNSRSSLAQGEAFIMS